MSTVATDMVKQLAREWSAIWSSAKVSGIVPDARHLRQGGYHCSRQDQPSSSNYSVVRPDDKVGPADAAAAIDMNMSRADMIDCTKRLVRLFADTTDPRRKYLNAFNGTTDGSTARRWDVYARKTKAASSDHTWHVHLEIRRRYVNSATAKRAILSALRGESKEKYLNSLPSSPSAGRKSPVPVFPGGVLKRDDNQRSPSPSVKLFQLQLSKRGLLPSGSADGFFGPKMEAAVKSWQKRIGLTPDGVIGPRTWPTVWTVT
jgi:hypothetical protein